MKRLITLAFLAFAIAVLAVRCSTPESILRYRMTVEVHTPTGPKTGNSVLELSLRRQNLIPLPGAGGADWGGGFVTYGEAPFVVLDNGQFLFVALRDATGSYNRLMTSIAFRALRIDEMRRQNPKDSDSSIIDGLVKTKALSVARPPFYPIMAMFTDISDPKTIVWISPDDLGTRFGAEYSVGKITLQVVDRSTPLTTAITTKFPALAKERGVLTLPAQ